MNRRTGSARTRTTRSTRKAICGSCRRRWTWTVTRMARCSPRWSGRFPQGRSPRRTRQRFRHRRRRNPRLHPGRSRHRRDQNKHRLRRNSRHLHRNRWSLLRLLLSRGAVPAVAVVARAVAASAAAPAVAVRRSRRRHDPCRRAGSGSHRETGTEPSLFGSLVWPTVNGCARWAMSVRPGGKNRRLPAVDGHSTPSAHIRRRQRTLKSAGAQPRRAR